MSTIKNLKPRSGVRVKVNFRQNKILFDDLYFNYSLAVKCQNTLPRPTFHLASIPFQWLFWKDAQARHPSNSTEVSQVSNTTATPLDSMRFHPLEVWRRRPASQAPGLCSFLAKFILSQVYVRNRVVDFQCFGKGLWTKNDGKPCEPEKSWELTRRSATPVKVKVNFRQNKILFDDLYFNFSLAVKCQKTLPRPTFHLASIPFQWLFWKDAQARHPSNSTEVSQVSNTTATPLDSMRFHRLEVWRRRPASQAPGLCSFLAKFILSQVDAPHTFVDFQCFGKGLWTINDGKPCATWKILRTCKAICDTNIKPCPPSRLWSQDHE